MAKKFPPGWYPNDNGELAKWDGRSWTGEVQPPAPSHRQPAWHEVKPALFRWWCGDHWSPAYAASDGHTDVLNNIGQAIVRPAAILGGEREAIAQIQEALKEYPPCRIDQLNTYPSALAAAVTMVAVISWASPS